MRPVRSDDTFFGGILTCQHDPMSDVPSVDWYFILVWPALAAIFRFV